MTSPTDEAATAKPYTKPLPEPTPASQPFWDAAREHRLVIQRSKQTGKYVFYPRVVSPYGAADELEWAEVSGRGTVYSYTVARRATGPQWSGEEPYVIAIVQLEEGPQMTTNIIGCPPDAVRIGMPVVAAFEDVTPDVTLVMFRPAAAT
ncbi:MAG: Zn-ribbon domain-containing OB-fold protein [Chloroflexi bacterium]|nr:Zn-ribbon domain-containing OB-fold protein [Chloroflexota bacterium]